MFCLKLLVHGRGAIGTQAMSKMCGLDSGFKHVKISHLYSQELTKLENCKPAEEKWRAVGVKLPVPMLSKRGTTTGCSATGDQHMPSTAGGMSLSVKFTATHNETAFFFKTVL